MELTQDEKIKLIENMMAAINQLWPENVSLTVHKVDVKSLSNEKYSKRLMDGDCTGIFRTAKPKDEKLDITYFE